MVQRARLILRLAEGRTYAESEETLGCGSPPDPLERRFVEERTGGLQSRYAGGLPRVRTAALEAKILEKTRTPPVDGSTHWRTRKLAAALGVRHMMVARVWARAGLQPHRLATRSVSTAACHDLMARASADRPSNAERPRRDQGRLEPVPHPYRRLVRVRT